MRNYWRSSISVKEAANGYVVEGMTSDVQRVLFLCKSPQQVADVVSMMLRGKHQDHINGVLRSMQGTA